MPIGIIGAKMRPQKPVPVEKPIEIPRPPVEPPPPPPPIPQPNIGQFFGNKGDVMDVALVCRTHKQALEFLSGMHVNMSAVQNFGITMSFPQAATASEISGAKRQLDRAFFNRVGQWSFGGPAEGVREYMFHLSASVQEQSRIQLTVRCGTPEVLAGGILQSADVVWVLLDGHLLEGMPDPYEVGVQNCLRSLDVSQKQVCLLLSQMERVSLYWHGTGNFSYPDRSMEQLRTACNNLLGGCLNAPAAVFPVQVYGCMDYAGVDSQGIPVLRMNTSSGYEPVACEAPALFAVANVCGRRGVNYFETTIAGGYLSVYRRYLSGAYDSKLIHPPAVGGAAQ